MKIQDLFVKNIFRPINGVVLGTFEEKLKHAAEQRISHDLDDGVKVNYGKFGDLLAEIKAVTDGKDDEG
jgi:hypothetical protein